MKAKPHVCKRSLTSASALYSFLTAAHIPAVGPVTEKQGGGGGGGDQSRVSLEFIIFSLYTFFHKSQQSPHQVTVVIDSISDLDLDGCRFSVSIIRAAWAGRLLSSLQNKGRVRARALDAKQWLQSEENLKRPVNGHLLGFRRKQQPCFKGET